MVLLPFGCSRVKLLYAVHRLVLVILFLWINSNRLIYRHKVYKHFRVAVPVVVCTYEKLSLKKPRELLAQAVGCSPACSAWVADAASFFVIAIVVSVIAVDNMVIRVDASVGNFFFAASITLRASTSLRSST